jgi:hypothetical protein
MGLQRDALSRASRAQPTETRHGRVPAIGGDERSGAKRLLAGGDLPMVRARIGRRKRGGRYRFKDRGAEFPRAVEEQLVEEASLDRDLGIVTHGKLDRDASSADSDELDTIQFSMRQTSNAVHQFEPSQDRPARRIQAVAANFLARKFLSFENHGSQTGRRAKGSAARPGRAAADDCDIEHGSFSWQARRASRIGDLQIAVGSGRRFVNRRSLKQQ